MIRIFLVHPGTAAKIRLTVRENNTIDMNRKCETESRCSRAADGFGVIHPASSKRIPVNRRESFLTRGPLINYFMLAAFFLLSLILRVWMLDKRWINPDEGAHLMDAVFTLQGHIPQVDFAARQTFYVLANAVWLKFWGVSYLYGRLFPMTCSLLTGIMVFLIARRLFNEEIALMAAITYLMLPLEVLNSVVVKTEPLANLLACLSFYLLLRFREGRNWLPLLLSGISAALGYYVRESLLVLLVLGPIVIAFERDRSLSETLRSLCWYIVGYGLVVLLYLGFYIQFTSANDLLLSSANPLGFVLRAINNIWRFLLIKFGLDAKDASGSAASIGTKIGYSLHYLRWTVFLHLFLFVGMAWAAFRIVFRGGASSRFNPLYRRSYFLSLSWVALLAAAYIYHYKTFGYYIDYFREFLPILAIIFAAYIWETLFQDSRKNAYIYSSVIAVAVLSAVFFLVRHGVVLPKGIQIISVIGTVAVVMMIREKQWRGSKKRALACVAALALFYFLSRTIGMIPRNPALVFAVGGMVGITAWMIPNRLQFLNICLAICCLVLSTTFAASIMGMRFDSVWSNEAVQRIAATIKENSNFDDEVMSGAVIWELESHRKPVAMISHPLAYRYHMPEEIVSKIEKGFHEGRPQIIVLDGYTEKIYMTKIPGLQSMLDNRYELIMENDEAKYPLRVFRVEKGSK